MKTLITERFAINGVLALLTLILAFHVLVVLGVVPSGIVWGGRIQNSSQLYTMEAVSIAINLLLLAMVAIKGGLLRVNLPPLFFKIFFWTMFALFLLNTVGNLLAVATLETILFTPITLLLSVFCFRLATSRA
ncbi:hypothetical protein [Telluribacter sp.]|jgi:hypothetical protein|uniref:hypothetical protein n=1 Tax=Telluribacter sp. TaxID=1978767 RepID=UPI002E139DD5|nr:hypothetical protein [Telluribacter sp.]